MQAVEDEFAKQTRDALASLYDPAALRAHPLSRALVPVDDLPSGAQGSALRDRLLAAIERLKPDPRVDHASRAWLPYRILQLRYVEARGPTDVQQELDMSKSQYYREHEGALASLTTLLREQAVWLEAAPAKEALLVQEKSTELTVDAGPAPGGTWPAGGRWLWLLRFASILVAGLALSIFFINRTASTPGDLAASGATSERASSAPPLGASLAVYAGSSETGHLNGAARLAQFAGPFGLGIERGGTVYVADTGNHRIRSVTTTGLVLDLAGSGAEGYADGPSATAQFSSPNAVTVGPDGTVYVGDAGNLRIRAISPSGVVSTLAGSGVAGYVDGVGIEAQFASAGAIVADPAGNLYVSDRFNSVIRKITPAGVVSTFAGSGVRGHVDGPPNVAQFNVPQRMGADPVGNVYILDTGDSRIRKITPDGLVSTLAGTGSPGFSDGPAAEAQFSGDILGITADALGNLYVMDAGNRRIRQVSPDGLVSTLFEVTNADQTPGNIKIDQAGNLYLSDREHNAIYKVTLRRSR